MPFLWHQRRSAPVRPVAIERRTMEESARMRGGRFSMALRRHVETWRSKSDASDDEPMVVGEESIGLKAEWATQRFLSAERRCVLQVPPDGIQFRFFNRQ